MVGGATRGQLVIVEDHLTLLSGSEPEVLSASTDQAVLRALVRDEFISKVGRVELERVAAAALGGAEVIRKPEAGVWRHPAGLPPDIGTLDERLVRIRARGRTLFISSCGQNGRAYEGRVWRRDARSVWTEIRGKGPSCLALLVHSNGQLFVAGAEGRIHRSSDDGDTWTGLGSGTTNTLTTLAQAADGTLFAAGAKGTVLRARPNGARWERLAPQVAAVFRRPLQADVSDLCVASPGVLYLCTVQGHILRSDDAGDTWVTLQSGVATPLSKLVARDQHHVVAVRSTGVVLSTSDGHAWAPQSSGTSADLEDVIVGNDGRLYAVSTASEVLCSGDGAVWAVSRSPADVVLRSLCATPNGTLWCVGDDGAVVEWPDVDVAAGRPRP